MYVCIYAEDFPFLGHKQGPLLLTNKTSTAEIFSLGLLKTCLWERDRGKKLVLLWNIRVVRKNFYPGIFLERKTFYVCAIKFCPL
jgi:hypothetical protein